MTVLLALLVAALLVWFLAAHTEYAYLIGGLAVVALFFVGGTAPLAFVPQRVFSQFDVFSLMALPLFLLTAEIMNRGGVTQALIGFAMALTGRSRGALGNVNIATSVFFAGVSGSAIADAASLGRTLVPVMTRKGYSLDYAASVTAASAIIGPIIPPSIIMILYGGITQTDIAALFAAGIVPGLLLAGVLMAANTLFAIRDDHPAGDAFDLAVVRSASIKALPALLLPVVILAGIVFGLTTPTEAGAIAVLVSLAAARHYGRYSFADFREAVEQTTILTGAMFILVGATGLASYLAALAQWPEALSEMIMASGIDGTGYLALVCTTLLIFGMFTGVRVGLFLLVPLLVPHALSTAVDPLHAGIAVCFALTLGLLTPPFGPALMAVSTVTGLELARLMRGVVPFLLIELAVLVVLVLFPQISTALPALLGLAA